MLWNLRTRKGRHRQQAVSVRLHGGPGSRARAAASRRHALAALPASHPGLSSLVAEPVLEAQGPVGRQGSGSHQGSKLQGMQGQQIAAWWRPLACQAASGAAQHHQLAPPGA